ncbi:hypothetical protein AGLY_009889 [Aphis glycines]|uniref:Uncharacterized protein n=1 Tax=Aphis glycines TaxID=307491 RepID=A0A6G0TJC8_APHGL|nr:hypothetical protein AGLY_009889 [Aphis glycines]
MRISFVHLSLKDIKWESRIDESFCISTISSTVNFVISNSAVAYKRPRILLTYITNIPRGSFDKVYELIFSTDFQTPFTIYNTIIIDIHHLYNRSNNIPDVEKNDKLIYSSTIIHYGTLDFLKKRLKGCQIAKITERSLGAVEEHQRMRNYLLRIEREGVQKVKMFVVITAAYVIFWGPLFFVTLVQHPLYGNRSDYECVKSIAIISK